MPRRCSPAKQRAPSPTLTRMKFAELGTNSRPSRRKPASSCARPGAVAPGAVARQTPVVQGRDRRGLADRVHVEWLAHPVEEGGERGARVAVADAQGGQAEDFRKGAQADDVAAFGEQGAQVGGIVDIVGVGFVVDQDDVVRERAGEGEEVRLRNSRRRWGCWGWRQRRSSSCGVTARAIAGRSWRNLARGTSTARPPKTRVTSL